MGRGSVLSMAKLWNDASSKRSLRLRVFWTSTRAKSSSDAPHSRNRTLLCPWNDPRTKDHNASTTIPANVTATASHMTPIPPLGPTRGATDKFVVFLPEPLSGEPVVEADPVAALAAPVVVPVAAA